MKQWMTFGIKTEGAEKAEKDIDGVAAASKKAEESQEGLNDSIESGTGALDKMTGGAIGAFKGVVGGVKKAVLGMKTLKGAMMATGIGALVVIVGSLVAYFTKTKKGAEILQVATAALGAVFGVLTDVLSSIGETMVWAFTSPQEALDAVSEKMEALGGWFSDLGNYLKEAFFFSLLKVKRAMLSFAAAGKELLGFDASGMRAEIASIDDQLNESIEKMQIASDKVTEPLKKAWKTVTEGVANFVDKVGKAISTASALEKRAVALADAQRNLSVEFAQTREKMNDLRMVGEDVTQEIGKRIKATEEAGALEIALAAKTLALAQEAVDIKRAQNNISESTAEDLQALADLEIALSNAQIESAGKQRGLLMKINGLYKEQDAIAAAVVAKEAARVKGLLDQQNAIDDIKDAGMARELQKIEEHWTEQLRLATEAGGELVGLEEVKETQLKEVRDKYQAIADAEAEAIRLAKEALDDKAEADAEAKREEIKNGVIQTAGAVLDGLTALNEAFTALSGEQVDANAARQLAISEETDEAKKKQLIETNNAILAEQEKQQKKGFENSKKLQIAQALIQTYSSATAAFSSLAGIPVVGPVLGGLAAAAAVAGGLAQIAMIKKTTFQGGGAGQQEYQAPPTTAEELGGGGGGAATAAAGTSPQIDLGFLGAGSGGSIQAYVISENVTNQQQADQIVTDQTTL